MYPYQNNLYAKKDSQKKIKTYYKQKLKNKMPLSTITG